MYTYMFINNILNIYVGYMHIFNANYLVLSKQ